MKSKKWNLAFRRNKQQQTSSKLKAQKNSKQHVRCSLRRTQINFDFESYYERVSISKCFIELQSTMEMKQEQQRPIMIHINHITVLVSLQIFFLTAGNKWRIANITQINNAHLVHSSKVMQTHDISRFIVKKFSVQEQL